MITNRLEAQRSLYWVYVVFLHSGLLLSTLGTQSRAQITLDGSLGPQAPLTGPHYTIPAAVGQIQGRNLFHSFGTFNVQTGEQATFTGPDKIVNILGRVTGGQRSVIDGTLRSEIPGANLYLLNPAGVVFGPHATLDVSGSLHVSTADFIRLKDSGVFHANLTQNSVLTVAAPVAFGFLQQRPAAIHIRESALGVSEGKTVAIVGGNLTIAGGAIEAPGGQVHLMSVASPGEVSLTTTRQPSTPRMDTVERLGKVSVSDSAMIDVSGERGGTVIIRCGDLRLNNQSRIRANTQEEMDGARRGIDINVTDTVTLTNGSVISAVALGAGAAGEIRLAAEHLRISNASAVASPTRPGVTGSTGKIAIDVGTLTLIKGGAINNISFGPGGERSILIVRASDRVTIQGQDPGGFQSGIFSSGFGREGGLIVLHAPTVRLTDGGRIESGALGPAHGGEIVIRAQTLTLQRGGGISSSHFGPGEAGTVTVRATGTVTIAGQGSELSSDALIGGAAGRVTLRAPTVRLMNGGTISTETPGEGPGGEIIVRAGTLALTGGASIDSSTRGTHPGGRVTVSAWDKVTITGPGSGLFSRTQGGGAAGQVTVKAPLVRLANNGSISVQTREDGRGGDIMIRAGTLHLSSGGRIDSSSVGRTDTSGPGGDIALSARAITLRQGAQISAESSGPGDAGAIAITVRDSLQSRDSAVTTAATAGAVGGAITITSQGIVQLHNSNLTASVAGGMGTGGDITLVTPTLRMTGGVIQATTAGAGPGGTIHVEARAVQLAERALISAAASGSGAAGNLIVTARETIQSTNSTITTTANTGMGGTITIEADTAMSLTTTDIAATVTGGRQPGGNIALTTPTLTVHGGRIEAETQGTGRAGDITLAVSNMVAQGTTLSSSSADLASGDAGTVTIRGMAGTGTTATTVHFTDSTLRTRAEATGAGGAITVAAGESLTLKNTTLSATVHNGADTPGGTRGDVTLQAPLLTLIAAHLEAETTGSRSAGDIRLEAATVVAQKTEITSSSTATAAGNAGTITIQGLDGPDRLAETVTLTETRVATEAAVADGGDIQIHARDIMRLRDSQITTAVRSGDGGGGNILIDPEFVILQRSQVQADAFGGSGGNVRIAAQRVFLADPDSRVSASSVLGIAGLVNIQSPVTNISGSLTALPQTFTSAPEVLHERCAARRWEGRVSTLIARGHEGIPARPGGVLPSPLYSIQKGTERSGKISETFVQQHTAVPASILRLDDNQRLRVGNRPVETFSPIVRNLECSK